MKTKNIAVSAEKLTDVSIFLETARLVSQSPEIHDRAYEASSSVGMAPR